MNDISCGRFKISLSLGSLGVLFFQAEYGIRDLVRSRGLGDVYKRQGENHPSPEHPQEHFLPVLDRSHHRPGLVGGVKAHRRLGVVLAEAERHDGHGVQFGVLVEDCLLYTSDAADERSRVDLGGRRIFKKKNNIRNSESLCR